ncbi:hypothetical protein CHU98_g2116 [Xylaria longipes]|nr:hypothetical protein CHU98_g2116 [Xylaria longipes]
MYSYSKNATNNLAARTKELGVFYDFIYLDDAAKGQDPYATYAVITNNSSLSQFKEYLGKAASSYATANVKIVMERI